MTSQRVLVTGATGFVGATLVERLARSNVETVACFRGAEPCAQEGVRFVRISGLSDYSALDSALEGVDVVVHAAARVHLMEDVATDPLAEFREVNVRGTLNLARQSAAAGVRRFVFISSIKVNGESTELNCPFRPDDIPRPSDAYGISKMEAERELRNLAIATGIEVVIIRPPLVYGSGVKANFQTMARWLTRGIPLPLGAIDNRRSLVTLNNLVDLIVTSINHLAAGNETFLVSDDEDLSTTDLLRRMGLALGKPARLLPLPPSLLKLGAGMLGKADLAQRLCGSLQVDISKTRRMLGWSPPESVEQGLRQAAEGYLRETCF